MASGSTTSAVCARKSFSVADVLQMVDEDEPIMEGSDDEFEDIQEEELHEVLEEEDEMEVMSTAYNLHSEAMEVTEGVTAESSNLPSAVESCAASQGWSSSLSSIRIEPFTSTTGPAFMVGWDPSEAFSHLFNDSILENVVAQTNLYAQQTMGAAKYNTWQKITLEELKAYLGFNVLMGLVQLPEIEDYWKQDPFFHYAPIADRIPRDRFRDISRYLHFCDNSTLAKRGYNKVTTDWERYDLC